MAFDEIVNNIPLVEALKKPIRCILPLPGFIENRICISYSGFEADYERPKLMSWLDALGEFLKRSTYKKESLIKFTLCTQASRTSLSYVEKTWMVNSRLRTSLFQINHIGVNDLVPLKTGAFRSCTHNGSESRHFSILYHCLPG